MFHDNFTWSRTVAREIPDETEAGFQWKHHYGGFTWERVKVILGFSHRHTTITLSCFSSYLLNSCPILSAHAYFQNIYENRMSTWIYWLDDVMWHESPMNIGAGLCARELTAYKFRETISLGIPRPITPSPEPSPNQLFKRTLAPGAISRKLEALVKIGSTPEESSNQPCSPPAGLCAHIWITA